MTHTVTETGSWQHTISIEVPVAEVETRIEKVARQLQGRVSMPGFRKGKVPLARVRTDFAQQIEQEFVETVIREVSGVAIRESGLNPVVPPSVDNLRFTPGQPMTFDVLIDTAPTVDVADWKGIALVRRVQPVDEAAVTATVERLRDDTAVFVDLDRVAAPGDVVLLDLQRLDANGRRLANTRAKGRRIEA